MERISLQGMTDEEKKARKRMQKNEAQKRYYLKNKEYYKERCGGWYKKKCEKLQNKLDKISEYVDKMYDVMDYKDYPPYLDDIYYTLHPELKED